MIEERLLLSVYGGIFKITHVALVHFSIKIMSIKIRKNIIVLQRWEEARLLKPSYPVRVFGCQHRPAGVKRLRREWNTGEGMGSAPGAA